MAKNNFTPRSKFERWVRKNGGSKEVAKELGVAHSTLKFWLSGVHVPKLETAVKIVKLSKNAVSLGDVLWISKK